MFSTYFLTLYLAFTFYLIYFLTFFSGILLDSSWYIFGDSLWLRSGGERSDPDLAVEVRREHFDPELAVEIRRGTL